MNERNNFTNLFDGNTAHVYLSRYDDGRSSTGYLAFGYDEDDYGYKGRITEVNEYAIPDLIRHCEAHGLELSEMRCDPLPTIWMSVPGAKFYTDFEVWKTSSTIKNTP